jgi:hypothetical protein
MLKVTLPASRPSKSVRVPSALYAVTEEQQVYHAICLTSSAGGSAGCDGPVPDEPGERIDDEDIYDTEGEEDDLATIEGQIALKSASVYYREVRL